MSHNPPREPPVVSALRHAIAEVKQRWSVMRWVTKNLLSRVPLCFGRHIKQLVAAALAAVSTHQSAMGPRGGLWPVLHVGNPQGRPVLHIKRLMMMMMNLFSPEHLLVCRIRSTARRAIQLQFDDHHQPINVPTAGAQALPINYT
jgi:hypothetical protein